MAYTDSGIKLPPSPLFHAYDFGLHTKIEVPNTIPLPSQRFGNAITTSGNLNLRHASFASDFSPIEPTCTCTCCRPVADGGLGITRAFIHHVAGKETAGAHL